MTFFTLISFLFSQLSMFDFFSLTVDWTDRFAFFFLGFFFFFFSFHIYRKKEERKQSPTTADYYYSAVFLNGNGVMDRIGLEWLRFVSFFSLIHI